MFQENGDTDRGQSEAGSTRRKWRRNKTQFIKLMTFSSSSLPTRHPAFHLTSFDRENPTDSHPASTGKGGPRCCKPKPPNFFACRQSKSHRITSTNVPSRTPTSESGGAPPL